MPIQQEQGRDSRILRCKDPDCKSQALTPVDGSIDRVVGTSLGRLVVTCEHGHRSEFKTMNPARYTLVE